MRCSGNEVPDLNGEGTSSAKGRGRLVSSVLSESFLNLAGAV